MSAEIQTSDQSYINAKIFQNMYITNRGFFTRLLDPELNGEVKRQDLKRITEELITGDEIDIQNHPDPTKDL